jgi:hypothetical protein
MPLRLSSPDDPNLVAVAHAARPMPGAHALLWLQDGDPVPRGGPPACSARRAPSSAGAAASTRVSRWHSVRVSV